MTNNDLFVAVDEILCYIWDPLGVSADGTPQTRDEYTSYVPKIVESLERDGSAELLLEKRRFLLEE